MTKGCREPTSLANKWMKMTKNESKNKMTSFLSSARRGRCSWHGQQVPWVPTHVAAAPASGHKRRYMGGSLPLWGTQNIPKNVPFSVEQKKMWIHYIICRLIFSILNTLLDTSEAICWNNLMSLMFNCSFSSFRNFTWSVFQTHKWWTYLLPDRNILSDVSLLTPPPSKPPPLIPDRDQTPWAPIILGVKHIHQSSPQRHHHQIHGIGSVCICVFQYLYLFFSSGGNPA